MRPKYGVLLSNNTLCCMCTTLYSQGAYSIVLPKPLQCSTLTTGYPLFPLSHGITWCHMMSHGITWCHMVSHDVTWCNSYTSQETLTLGTRLTISNQPTRERLLEGWLTDGLSELLEVRQLLVVGALLHPGLHQPRLMAPPLLLLLQLPPPGWGKKVGLILTSFSAPVFHAYKHKHAPLGFFLDSTLIWALIQGKNYSAITHFVATFCTCSSSAVTSPSSLSFSASTPSHWHTSSSWDSREEEVCGREPGVCVCVCVKDSCK